jgi:SlyX protein
MQDELIELQSKLSFQDQTLFELNSALVSQQQQIDSLQRQIKLLEGRIADLEGQALPSSGEGQHEKPPHY